MLSLSLYLHRSIGHGYYTVKHPLDYIFRVILWTTEKLGPKWAETYTSRHIKHHATSDSLEDPHSPLHMTIKELCQSWTVDPNDVAKYSPNVKTPDDWMQRNLHEKYRKYGSWTLYLLCFILYGFWGFVIMYAWRLLTNNWFSIVASNWLFHSVGFTYAGNKGTDRSRNLFPIAILQSGEELHANHHNRPKDAKFSQRWFEFDMGWVYIKIFEKLGLIEFKKEK
jgi:fatty-acid desaturase